MIEDAPKQVLLIAPDLLGESLSIQLNSYDSNLQVFLKKEELTQHPSLVIWSVESLEIESITMNEIMLLKDKWKPSPLLLLLPARTSLNPNEILNCECEGILQNPDIHLLKETITNLFNGGRVVRLNEPLKKDYEKLSILHSLGNGLLANSLESISKELNSLNLLSTVKSNNLLRSLVINGRRREIKSAKALLLRIWAPIHISYILNNSNKPKETRYYSTNITIPGRGSKAVWSQILERTGQSIKSGIGNNTGSIFAIQALNEENQRVLLSALLHQIDNIISNFQKRDKLNDNYVEEWISLENEIRKQAIRQLSGSYTRLMKNGKITSIADQLLETIDLNEVDEELPRPSLMLDTLVLEKPLLVEGSILSSDDPRSLLKLETLIMNWLIRTGELISSELISLCSEWPELREYLLAPALVSTRELERLRNQLNSQRRWHHLIELPIQLYESKRELFTLNNGKIDSVLINEARDNDLKRLDWWQKQITLLVEARDALSPQLQSLLKYIGDLMVVLLTNVLGRAIGLVGKGIAQGMGRTISR
ncbi:MULTISPECIES: DUF3685 domain-containing protein [unclassified Prochlorococcus]|uniref:DUF3685 domain-containing protein n=1 Tax=unclassified Prochlorococcus TaxID=2627481 RepID=UPI0005338D2A|nr:MULTISPECIES: DUF3685 domain-containing protein [unclassified Prochlorococcus]KGG15188.1 CheY-like domain containing protein [Prochlorococcus sp. MIT 0602]KGG17462.1 CheY-like domain containing protein [Prochlorococcus sp. MIT 0603]